MPWYIAEPQSCATHLTVLKLKSKGERGRLELIHNTRREGQKDSCYFFGKQTKYSLIYLQVLQ